MIHVVYFNQWFSSMTMVMKDLKDKHKNDLRIIASSKNPIHVYKNFVDEFIVEDWQETGNDEVDKINYLNWLNKTFIEYNVDIAFIRKHSSWVSRSDSAFPKHVRIILEDYDTIEKLNTKSKVYYELMGDTQLGNIVPEYYTGKHNREKILEILSNEHKVNKGWCFKLDNDEGGKSFRRIETKPFNSIEQLKSSRFNSVSIPEAIEFFNTIINEDASDIIFMELLEGPEISVDCYDSRSGFVAICREKQPDSRVQKIYRDLKIEKICKIIKNKFNITYPFNVQFRYKADTTHQIEDLRLMDLNLRMSGGIYQASAIGFNICEMCTLDFIDKPQSYNLDNWWNFKDRLVTHYERIMEIN